MRKRYVIIIFAVILTIAYFDMLDSIKHINNIISDMLKLDAAIKTELDISSTKK